MIRRLAHTAGRAVDEHPQVVVAALGALVVVTHLVWVARSRPLGTFDADEAGYMANALRLHRNLTPGPLWAQLSDTSTGPLMPLLSVPFVLVGSRSVAWLMVVPALLHALSAVAATGIGRLLGGPRTAVAAGVVTLGMPGMLLAGRSYQLAAAATATLLLAVWALLASDRCRRPWHMLAFGLAVGCMLLARTMTVTFVPAIAVAVAIYAARERRALRNAALAVVAALAVAAPWWVAAWGGITGYLTRYGYGDRAASYGTSNVAVRALQRTGVVVSDLRIPLSVVAIAALALGLHAAWRRYGTRVLAPLLASARGRSGAAILAIVVGSQLTLLTSSNNGYWFELPLVALLVPLVCALAALTPPRVLRPLTMAALVVSGVNLVVMTVQPTGGQSLAATGFFADMYSERAPLVEPDPRLGPRTTRGRAAAEWWSSHHEVAAAISRHRVDGLTQTTAGSSPLFNHNSLLLAQELASEGPDNSESADTTAPDLSPWLSPAASRGPRMLVSMAPRSEPFPPDTGHAAFRRAARESGWVEVARASLPDGGDVIVLLHPSNPAG